MRGAAREVQRVRCVEGGATREARRVRCNERGAVWEVQRERRSEGSATREAQRGRCNERGAAREVQRERRSNGSATREALRGRCTKRGAATEVQRERRCEGGVLREVQRERRGTGGVAREVQWIFASPLSQIDLSTRAHVFVSHLLRVTRGFCVCSLSLTSRSEVVKCFTPFASCVVNNVTHVVSNSARLGDFYFNIDPRFILFPVGILRSHLSSKLFVFF